MDLHVVHVLKGDAVACGDGARVAGKAGEVGGARVRAADAAAGPKRLTCENAQLHPVCRVREDAAAARLRLMGLGVALRCRYSGNKRRAVMIFNVGRVLRRSIRFALRRHFVPRRNPSADLDFLLRDQDVVHAGVFQDADVGQLAYASKQRGSDLVAGDVAVEADARAAVRALAGVAKVARLVALEVHAAFHQVGDDAAACADHQVHALAAILVVAGAQGVLEKRRVVGVVVLHADAALRQHGVAFVHGRLRQHHHGKRGGKVERAVQARHAAADDDHVAGDIVRLGCDVAFRLQSVTG